MKKVIVSLFFTVSIFSMAVAQQSGSLNFLKQYNGKYPHDVNLFSNPDLKATLQKLLGTQFTYLVKNIFQTEAPVKIANNFVYLWGMQDNSGGDPSATILADVGGNILYVKILKDNQTKIYAEDGSGAVTKEVDDWAQKQSPN